MGTKATASYNYPATHSAETVRRDMQSFDLCNGGRVTNISQPRPGNRAGYLTVDYDCMVTG